MYEVNHFSTAVLTLHYRITTVPVKAKVVSLFLAGFMSHMINICTHIFSEDEHRSYMSRSRPSTCSDVTASSYVSFPQEILEIYITI